MKTVSMPDSKSPEADSVSGASELILQRIAELDDWRGEALARVRRLIREAAPDVVEEWKWRGTPVWARSGIICTGESYRTVVKLTFAKGASLEDPARMFNSSLDGNVRRAIDIHDGEEFDAEAFKELVRRAVALNLSKVLKPSELMDSRFREVAPRRGVPSESRAADRCVESAEDIRDRWERRCP